MCLGKAVHIKDKKVERFVIEILKAVVPGVFIPGLLAVINQIYGCSISLGDTGIQLRTRVRFTDHCFLNCLCNAA